MERSLINISEGRGRVSSRVVLIGATVVGLATLLQQLGLSQIRVLGLATGVLYLILSIKMYEIVVGYLIGIHRSFIYFISGVAIKLAMFALLVIGVVQCDPAQSFSFLIGLVVLILASMSLMFWPNSQ